MSSSDSHLVLRNDHDVISTLAFNRPDALNALSPSLFAELEAHLDDLAKSQEEIGVIVLTGRGRLFLAGNDLKAIERGERATRPHQQAELLDFIETMPQPVIASVRGHCYTGALELAIACDLLICADDANLQTLTVSGAWCLHGE